MTSRKHRHAVTLFGLCVSALFLWLALRDTNLRAVLDAASEGDWRYVPAIFATLVVYFAVKTLRWKYLLLPVGEIRTASLFPVVVVGYASNLLLPAQLGELVRVFLAGQKFRLKSGSVLTTVILERMFDFLTILLFVGLLLAFESRIPEELVVAAYVCGGVGLVLLVAVGSLTVEPRIVRLLVRAIDLALPDRFASAVTNQLEAATAGLNSLRSLRLFALVCLTSVLQWILMGLCAWFAMIAFDLGVPPSAAFVVLAVIVVGMTIPSSPGFFGTIQLCFTLGLAPYGVASAEAIATSIYFHGVLFVSVAVGGIVFLRYLGYSPHALVERVESADTNEPGALSQRD